MSVIQPGSVGSDMQPCSVAEQREAIANGELLFAEEIAEAIIFVLTRSARCDNAMLQIEPIRRARDAVIWIGTYAAEGSAGLQSLKSVGGSLSLGPAEARIVNASFGVWSAERSIAYFVDERRVSAWRRQSGTWSAMGDTESGGSAPCYLSLSPDDTRMAAVNYGDGTLALIDLDPVTGAVQAIRDRFQPQGRGSDPDRKDGPHAHCALFAEDG